MLMKYSILLFCLCIFSFTQAQNKEAAEKLVSEGVVLHDNGDYDGAIAKYNKALENDEDNLLALAEIAMTYVTIGKYDVGITYCIRAIEKHKGQTGLENVYVSYGNALDLLKRTEEALKVYDEGIASYPTFYQLHFNKGISFTSIKKYEEAIACFEKSIRLQPNHPGSLNALARSLYLTNKKIPALLVYSRFMTLEPGSKRASENLAAMQELITGGAEKTGKNSVTINLDPNMFGDTTADGKNKENNFSSVELLLSLGASLNLSDKESKKKNEAKKFADSFESLCSSLATGKDENSGFYWEYFAPFFIEMMDKKQIETFSYIVFLTADDWKVSKWIKGHEKELTEFLVWSNDYKWPAE